MSDELIRIEDQIRRSVEGAAWHGPALLEAVEGIGCEEASARPIAGAHTIWEILLHLTATYLLVLRRMDGDARPLTPEEDWPTIPGPTDQDWRAAVDALRVVDAHVRTRILSFSPDRLDAPLVEEPPYSAYMQFIGLAEHNLYHAGQMVLLRRARSGGDAAAAPGAPRV